MKKEMMLMLTFVFKKCLQRILQLRSAELNEVKCFDKDKVSNDDSCLLGEGIFSWKLNKFSLLLKDNDKYL